MAAPSERVLPHNLDAERSVLGCLLVENARFIEIADTLSGADFFRDAHRRIFEAARALHDRGRTADYVTLKEEIGRRGELDDVGGPAYIASLTDGMPRGVNLPHYAAIVREKAQRRRLIFTCTKIVADAYEGEPPIEDLIEQAEADVLAVGQEVTGSDFVLADQWIRETYEHLERLASDPRHVVGLSTGFRDLDALTRGLQPTDLIIIGARPSMGKTAVAVQIALHAAQHGMVGVFSVEMARLSLGIRAVSLTSRVNGMRLMTGRTGGTDFEAISSAFSLLGELKIAIDDSPILTPMQLRTKARRLKARHGLSALFIDYLQILEPGSTGKRRAENRTLELAQMSRSLKALAKELHIPVVVLSQLSRDAEKRADPRPKLSDLRESGAIEQDADLVLLLHRPEYYQETPRAEDLGRAELIVAKQRHGPTGVVELRFTKEFTRFDDWSGRAA